MLSPRTASLTLLLAVSPLFAQKEHGFDNRKPSGQDYWSPEKSVAGMKVPPGWEVSVFAAEPDVINPVAFTIDEKGRVWVVECFEYPSRTQKGKKPRDRIKILEDTDGDGKCDKVTVWAEGKDFPTQEYPTAFDLATGIEVGDGGVYLGAAPFLFHLKDASGKGKCDTHKILLRGFGSQDTHETLNTFQWGPDGQLYGLHGVFTNTQVGEVKMNAAVWRYDTAKAKFEIFAEGTSNPWGMDFDSKGQCFLACCVIPHLFHMIPGGTYKRQAGTSFNPYAYGLLNEICDHIHHKESGWAHAGLLYMDGDHVPEEYRGSLIMGSIHGCMIKRDTLRKNGSTFTASHAPDFMTSVDKNFRPINLRWGPDGSIYLIDWHDQNPCHQAAANSWDQTHGRIYRIKRKDAKEVKAEDLSKKSSKELVELLKNDNPYQYRTALRLLRERRDTKVFQELLQLTESKNEVHVLRGLWGLHATGLIHLGAGLRLRLHSSPAARLWAVRALGEPGFQPPIILSALVEQAGTEESPEVRLQLACTAQRLVNQDTLPLLQKLMLHKEDATDPAIPLLIWLALEPRLTEKNKETMEWLAHNATDNPLITNEIAPRAIRRLLATGKPEDVAACVLFLGQAKDGTVQRKALEGFIQALQGRTLDAPDEWKATFTKLLANSDPEVQRLARRLAVNFRDVDVVRRALATLRAASKSRTDRLDAIRDLALAVPPDARQLLLDVVRNEKDVELRTQACRALSGYDHTELAKGVLDGWSSYPQPLRIEAVNLLAGRKEWASALLGAVAAKKVARTDLTDNTILRMRAFKDKKLDDLIQSAWGQFRDTPAELAKLINSMRGQLHEAPASFERGRKVFDNQCAKCHKFEGRGHDVGPNLDGAARDIEYLLVNVLDPNRVVGAPYFTRVAVLKSGRVESGLLVEEDGQSITLKVENDARKVIQKKDIDDLQVQQKSVMPEGLDKAMNVQDFRDLVRYVMAHPFVTTVEVAGPYVDPDPPSLDPADPRANKLVKWTHRNVGAPGRIVLRAAKGAGIGYIHAELTATEPIKTQLLLGAIHPVEAWVNGKPVFKGKPGAKADEPDQTAVDVVLEKGLNRIVLRVYYHGENETMYARLLDPDRKLRYPERPEKGRDDR